MSTETDSSTRADDLLDRAWFLLANASDWAKKGTDWQTAAAKWRDEFHRMPPSPLASPGTRALIEAKREGYVRAMQDNTQYKSYDAIKLARQTFPYPKVKRPLRVTLSGGSVFTYEPRDARDDCPFLIHTSRKERYTAVGVAMFIMSVDDILAVGRILSGEQEDVDAEECSPAPPADGRGSLNSVQGIR